MSFRIEKHTALFANGFREALRGQLAHAIKELDVSSRIPRAARIHSARRRVKKVRSVYRLLEAAEFPRVSQIDHDLLRDASAEVALPRCMDANVKALKKLCSHSGSDRLRFSKAFAVLEKQRFATSPGTAASMRKAATLLKGALSRIESWDDDSIRWMNVRRGLELFYKRGRTAFRKAAEDSTTENFHKLRKCAKEIFHSLKLVHSVNPKAVRRLSRPAKKLGAMLGIDHDLAILQETLGQCGIGNEKTVIEKLITTRRHKLQCKALRLGAKYFSRKPGAFIDKIDSVGNAED